MYSFFVATNPDYAKNIYVADSDFIKVAKGVSSRPCKPI